MSSAVSSSSVVSLAVSPRGGWIAFGLSLLALSTALALRDVVSVWIATGTAACIGIASAWIAAPHELRARLRIAPRWIAAALAIGVAMSIATHVLYPIGTVLVPGLEGHVTTLYRDLQDPPGPRAAVPVLMLVVLAEELVFRGLLVALLERWAMGRAALLVIATALYVVPQIAGGSWVLIGLSAACGALWTWQRVVSGSIAAPLITHVLWDLIVFVLVPLSTAAPAP